ncbi:type I-F CRISPR-associated helicase Cas3 [Verminephrobacter aporrectodeae subsp. tuberculatae]|uniref:type I-F CRISPR-associated helicase Cas3f n=1 Tax=Verminephrobacter aporrectodeae TaxID=1110389 RepID=UPI0022387C4D|nr:type I-F CRISPR-associated helicase Cas3f [Verminephrobacter aporrectodeae]MCW5221545.1 type I-F CRISPR-associated helicase Cas3 [Verminephrobacter aporrectodeae subsp. tuberculatae]MCW5290836.1 type I-F CRISPR-associated helicase Cas3 [Verminephrobacter aporrectodeae subsp. tuberculatae]
MNVLFISQCSKRALTETRRILDQFAERRGERTWQTPITADGLDTVRRLLRKTARKNTAVACHWIRGLNHSELLWIAGDGRQFNAEGAVPTNTSTSNLLRAEDERTWHHLPLMTALTALAALMHDLGKATQAFQDRLRNPGCLERNHYRHEWVSVRLFQALVGSDDDAGWLARLATCAQEGQDGPSFEALWLDRGRLLRDGLDEAADQSPPFAKLPPLARAVAWLVLTHHRLPCQPVKNNRNAPDDEPEASRSDSEYLRFGARLPFVNANELHDLLARVNADWNEPRGDLAPAQIGAYWRFAHGLPVGLLSWRKQAARYAEKLQGLAAPGVQRPALHDPFTMHVSRLCLMLADHHYSRIEDTARRAPYLNAQYPLYANTRQNGGSQHAPAPRQGSFNQTLDEHLLGVQAHATRIARSLPTLARSLPALQNHRGLKKRSSSARFQWQDKAADLAASVRHRAEAQGAFIVNMASTGCGKTLGNARIMNALADPATGLRCAFAIGLRTLTLQTGRSFQKDLGLSDEQLAIRVGGSASRALFDYWEQQAESTGSASCQALLDEGGQVLFEGHAQHPLLERLSDDPLLRSLLTAPLLVCTVDHLTPATESLRGGRQIAPMLRLMTGDLVLDEPDDFDMADLPALTRLVHWAGLLGARLLLSSATLPPALVEGLYLAYREGRTILQRHRSQRPDEPVNVCCLWIDEFHQSAQDCPDGAAFRMAHTRFAEKRVAQLAKAEVRRRGQIVALPAPWGAMDEAARREDFARFVLQCAWDLHQRPQNHGLAPDSGKRVSLGLIRMANIDPLFDVARAIYRQGAPAPGVRLHLCVYHAQFPLLVRSAIERRLDTLLDRRAPPGGADPVLHRSEIRALLDAHPEPDHLFVVLGSPVTEVGRDHDYDWAVVEPSSMRSLIQLAGRVRRHRPGAVSTVNMTVLDSNLRACERPGEAAFCRPGFEMNRVDPKADKPTGQEPHDSAWRFYLEGHGLTQLLESPPAGFAIDARPRVVAAEKPKPRQKWIDLEHERMRDTMLPRAPSGKFFTPPLRNATLHWHSGQCLWLTGLLPQYQRFRDDSTARVDVAFLPDEDENDLLLHMVTDTRKAAGKLYAPAEEKLKRLKEIRMGPGIAPWLKVSLVNELTALAHSKGIPLRSCAEKYAVLSLPKPRSHLGWVYHDTLGFTKEKTHGD